MQEGIARIRNARKNSDWPLIQDEFAGVNKLVEKSKMLIMQSGLPNFYVKMLMEIEDHVQLALKDKDAIKKMKPVVSRALNQMKLQVRKHNEVYKEDIADCRANPEKYAEVEEVEKSSSESSESEDSDADSESSESVKKPTKAKAKKAAGSDSDEDSLFDGEGGDSGDESSVDERTELKGRAKWLKKVPSAAEAADARKKADDAQAVKRKKEEAAGKRKIEAAEVTTVRKPAMAVLMELKMTEEELDKKVAELMSTRGRKNTDPRDVLRQLEVLTKAARLHGARKEMPVLMHLISAMLDSQRSIDDYLDAHQWRTCYRSLFRVVTLLDLNKKLSLGMIGADEADMSVSAHLKVVSEEVEEVEEVAVPFAQVGTTVIKVVGSIDTFLLRLQDEYTKALQQINPHTREYVIRLSDEASLIELSEAVLAYFQRIGDSKSAANAALLVVDHMYYKHDSHASAVRRAHVFNKTWGKYGDLHPACVAKGGLPASGTPSSTTMHPAAFLGPPTVNSPPFNPAQRLQELCTYIFRYGDKRLKTRALLAMVHHHALHDNYYKARDLLLISHIQEFADKFDVKSQILYNRAVVALGLCAFRLGLYQKAHDCLAQICSGRVKELLAQGQMKWADKDPEQEKVERRRQMPYHMHINPDLLELCHLTSAMILELPNLARASITTLPQSHVTSRFRKYYGGYSSQIFRGPPENTREHILAATKALLSGEWQKAVDYLMGLEVWNLIPVDGAEKAKVFLRARVKEEAVRTYLLLNGDYYDSLSLAYICELFDMDEPITRRIISKMIYDREISAAWDTPEILVIYKTDPTPLQTISQHLSEKMAMLLESNERTLDPLVGVYGYKEDWSSRDQRGGKYDKGRGGRGGGGRYGQSGRGGQGGRQPYQGRGRGGR
ncbi:eukaryotic translation initiation factor 3 subunit 8 N-terminus-domain-containing protein, partial [Ochromonadaceae sp. CCMP2298]